MDPVWRLQRNVAVQGFARFVKSQAETFGNYRTLNDVAKMYKLTLSVDRIPLDYEIILSSLEKADVPRHACPKDYSQLRRWDEDIVWLSRQRLVAIERMAREIKDREAPIPMDHPLRFFEAFKGRDDSTEYGDIYIAKEELTLRELEHDETRRLNNALERIGLNCDLGYIEGPAVDITSDGQLQGDAARGFGVGMPIADDLHSTTDDEQ